MGEEAALGFFSTYFISRLPFPGYHFPIGKGDDFSNIKKPWGQY